jgi:hypothetical protein
MLNIYEDGYDSYDVYKLFFYDDFNFQSLHGRSIDKINQKLANKYNQIFGDNNNATIPFINKKLLSYYCVT